jgi:hypothetical protein
MLLTAQRGPGVTHQRAHGDRRDRTPDDAGTSPGAISKETPLTAFTVASRLTNFTESL